MGYREIILSDSPLRYFRLGETSGTTATDSSGNGGNGTYTGGYTLGQTGAIASSGDGAVSLNGSSGYVSVPDATSLRLATSFTVEAWMYPTTSGTFRTIIGKCNAIGNSRNYDLDLDQTTGRPRLYVTQSASYVGFTGTVGPTLSQWSHLVGTYDGTALRLYLNGVAIGSTPCTGSVDTTTDLVGIGVLGVNGTANFAGSIDEVAIYATALSARRIMAHYTEGLASAGLKRPWGVAA